MHYSRRNGYKIRLGNLKAKAQIEEYYEDGSFKIAFEGVDYISLGSNALWIYVGIY
jgi:hypothetical protein